VTSAADRRPASDHYRRARLSLRALGCVLPSSGAGCGARRGGPAWM